MKTRFLAFLTVLCLLAALCLPALSAAADAAYELTYIDADLSDDDPVFSKSLTPTDKTVAVYINGLENGATYGLSMAEDGLLILGNDIALSGDISFVNYVLLSGTASFTAGGLTVTAGAIPSCTATSAEEIFQFYVLCAMTAAPCGEVSDDVTLPGVCSFSSLAVNSGTLTVDGVLMVDCLDVFEDGAVHVNAPTEGEEPNELFIGEYGALNAEGPVTADEGQLLELGDSSTVSGVELYWEDGEASYPLTDDHATLIFASNGSVWCYLGGGEIDGPGLSQYQVFYDMNCGDVYIDDVWMGDGEVGDFTEGEPLQFSLYYYTEDDILDMGIKTRLLVNGTDPVPLSLDFEEGCYTASYTPENTDPLTFEVYWSEEDYAYSRFEGDVEFVPYGWGSLQVSDEYEYSSYNGNFKVLAPEESSTVRVGLIPDEPLAGQTFDCEGFYDADTWMYYSVEDLEDEATANEAGIRYTPAEGENPAYADITTGDGCRHIEVWFGEPIFGYGDVDWDGSVTTTDARLTLQYAAEKIDGDELNLYLGNVDGDLEDNITTTDARMILQYAAGKIDFFPAERILWWGDEVTLNGLSINFIDYYNEGDTLCAALWFWNEGEEEISFTPDFSAKTADGEPLSIHPDDSSDLMTPCTIGGDDGLSGTVSFDYPGGEDYCFLYYTAPTGEVITFVISPEMIVLE